MSEPRSWLFVPADSEKKIAKAIESEADAVIFDLERMPPFVKQAHDQEQRSGRYRQML